MGDTYSLKILEIGRMMVGWLFLVLMFYSGFGFQLHTRLTLNIVVPWNANLLRHVTTLFAVVLWERAGKKMKRKFLLKMTSLIQWEDTWVWVIHAIQLRVEFKHQHTHGFVLCCCIFWVRLGCATVLCC